MPYSLIIMGLIRQYQEKKGICIFDAALNEQLSSYDFHHLDELEKAEKTHFWFRWRKDKICDVICRYIDPQAAILEVGGGTGFIAQSLQQLGYRVAMSDVAANGLLYARQKGLSPLYQFDLFNPPFKEEFDAVCFFDVLEHLDNDIQALKQLKTMLKPRGKIVLTVPAHRWLWSRDDAIAGHKKRYNRTDLQKAFLIAGLRPLKIEYFFTAIVPFLWARTIVKKDSGRPISNPEAFSWSISPFWNRCLSFLTKVEFALGPVLPNFTGGSLIAVAEKT